MSLHGELAILNVNVICNIDITVQNQATIIFFGYQTGGLSLYYLKQNHDTYSLTDY